MQEDEREQEGKLVITATTGLPAGLGCNVLAARLLGECSSRAYIDTFTVPNTLNQKSRQLT